MPISAEGSRGLTLWEALIVLLIVSVLAASAAPGLRRQYLRLQENAEARALLAAFQQARSNAVRHNRHVFLEFNEACSETPGGYRVFAEDRLGNRFELRPFEPFSALRLEKARFGTAATIGGFDHRGLHSNGSGSLQLNGLRAGSQFEITQTLYGGVRLKP